MTLAASQNYAIFDGDGVTTTFPYTFGINTTDGSDISVYYIDSSGTVTLVTSNYSVDVANSRVLYPTVAGVSPLASTDTAVPVGAQLELLRVEPLSQTVQLVDQGVFDPASIETGMDKITMICQQLQEQINRCVKYPLGTSPTTADVDAFIAAVSAIIQPPVISGTLAYLKSVSEGTPTTVRFGIATNLGTGNALMWYCGNATLGDEGWFGPLAGG